MTKLSGRVISVSVGGNEDLSKDLQDHIELDFDGIVGDQHAGHSREAYSGEREPKGSILRNDRQWSGASVEELAVISERLDLSENISPATVGANICVEGIADFSLLPGGTRLKFPSGAALRVEAYNPPCIHMGAQIAKKYVTNSGKPLTNGQWLKPASGRRGLVGVVDVPGKIKAGDEVTVEVFKSPEIRRF